MKIIKGPDTWKLSTHELNRIHAVLRRRYQHFDNGNILNLSFGISRQHEQKTRCVRFWVRKKRNPRKSADRIPEVVTVRLWQPRKRVYHLARFPTDVVGFGSIKPTGEYIATGETLRCSGGTVLEIQRELGHSDYQGTGLLTVAHAFEDLAALPIPVICQGRTVNGITGKNAHGRIRYRSLYRKFDSCFIEAGIPELQAANYLTRSTVSRAVLSESEIYQLETAEAPVQLLRPGAPPYHFSLTDYMPETLAPLPNFGQMRGVLMGPGTLDDFSMFSSGSPWISLNRPAAIQFAYYQTDAGEEFGLGQALFAVLEEYLGLGNSDYRILNVF